MARSSALIAPVQPVLYRVSCSNETLPNATKYYETHQNMSLGSNGVDRECSLKKIPVRFRGTNFCINAPVQPVLHQASCSSKTIQNAPKQYEMQQYMSLRSNGVDQVHLLRKFPKQLHGINLCINCTSSTHFAPRVVL
jgi:hypothetical protein